MRIKSRRSGLSRFEILTRRISRILDQLFESKQTITYGELAARLGSYLPRNAYIARALGNLLVQDAREGKPLRSSLVINKKKKHPSDGYFWVLYHRLKKISADKANAMTLRFWREQLLGMGVEAEA